MLNKINLYDVINGIVITEKSSINSSSSNEAICYIVRVAKWANKLIVRRAFEEIFNAKVLSVNILNTKSKIKRFKQKDGIRSGFKKAIIRTDKVIKELTVN